MSPYERQIDPLTSVDLSYVVGVPGQASSTEDEHLTVLYRPARPQRADPPVPGTVLRPGVRLALATAGLALVAGIGLAAYGDADGTSDGQVARANGGATAQVLAQDLGVGLGTYAVGGLPVTLTNTTDGPLAYNVTVEAVDAAGARVTADVAFLGTLAAGQSAVVTMFANATGDSVAALAASTFRVVEASSY